LILAGLAAVFAVSTAQAQTPEGTEIWNKATATYTDANSNSYAAIADSVMITVGFQAGIDVIAGAATATPAVSSTDNTITFDVDNIGNGTDSVNVAENISVGSIITVTGYQVEAGGWLTTLAELNDSLSDIWPLATGAGNGITVTVRYDVLAGTGGQTTYYRLTGTSLRDGGESDVDSTAITPGQTFGVTLTSSPGPADTVTASELPSNGTNYTVIFRITNNGNGPEDFDLLTTQIPGSAITVVSIAGTGVTQGGDPDSALVSAVGAGAFVDLTVTYSVGQVAAGTADTLVMTTYARNDKPTTTDDTRLELTVIRPDMSITKLAYTDAGRTTPVAGNVLPGQSIWYEITVTNGASNSDDATSIDINDDLPTEVTYVTHGDDGSGWTISKLDGPPEHMDATLASLAPGASASFWVQVTID
jgi:hypothetical protein